MYKIALVLCIVGAALAQYGHHKEDEHHYKHEHHKEDEQHKKKEEEHFVDYYAHPKYKFEYSVEDEHSHDFKKQEETRDGDKVKGYYTLKEADGTVRIVHYEADKKNGFNAKVERKGKAVHPIVKGSSETFFKHSHEHSHGHSSDSGESSKKHHSSASGESYGKHHTSGSEKSEKHYSSDYSSHHETAKSTSNHHYY